MFHDIVKRIFAAPMISGAICLALIGVLILSYHLDAERNKWTIKSDLHLGVFDGAIYAFSYDFPVLGGTFCGDIKTTQVHAPGFFYLIWRSPTQTVVWTLSVSLLYFIIIAAILPFLSIYRVVRSKHHNQL
jgi:hypothetical protein